MSSPSSSPPSPSSSSSSSEMWRDIGLQAFLFLIGIITFLWSNKIPHKLYSRYTSYRDRPKILARQHFVKSATFLSKARASQATNPSLALSYAAKAASEADHAISFDPSDAAYHVIKALALDLQSFKTSALESINVALSPVAVKSLLDDEKADALIKRAELRMDVSRIGSGRVDGSVLNVVEVEVREALVLKKESARGWCVLGVCLEEMGRIEDAKNAFSEAVRIESDCVEATRGLERLGS